MLNLGAAWACLDERGNQPLKVDPAPETALPDIVLGLAGATMAIVAEAYSAPVVRLLSHASTGAEPNVSKLHRSHRAAFAAGVISDKITVSGGFPPVRTL